jgi:DNA transformation protein
MASSSEFVEFIIETLALFGPVIAKRMFGGYGLYLDGLMFALVADDVLYFKADEVSRRTFERAGSVPFTYAKNGKDCKMSYYTAPDDALEDAQELSMWAQKAHDAALRAHKEKA